jgi:hypothetical protein
MAIVVPGRARHVRSQHLFAPAVVLGPCLSPHRTDCCRSIRRRGGEGEVSRADSRVRSPGVFTRARGPPVTSALDAVPEAYHNLAAVWWGAFALSVVIWDQVVIAGPVAGLLGQQRLRQDHQRRRSVCAAGRPAFMQVSRCIGLSGSDCKFPALTGLIGLIGTRNGHVCARREDEPHEQTQADRISEYDNDPPQSCCPQGGACNEW